MRSFRDTCRPRHRFVSRTSKDSWLFRIPGVLLRPDARRTSETRINRSSSREYKCAYGASVWARKERRRRIERYARVHAPLQLVSSRKGEKRATPEEGRVVEGREAKEKRGGGNGWRVNRDEGKRKEIARRGLQEGSALSCKSVRSLSPPGGMVAYVKAGYTPRDEWTLFHQRFFF